MKSGAANNCAIRSDFATFLAAKCLEDSLILWQNYSQLRNSWLHEFHRFTFLRIQTFFHCHVS